MADSATTSVQRARPAGDIEQAKKIKISLFEKPITWRSAWIGDLRDVKDVERLSMRFSTRWGAKK